jgi:hypothetical protein
MTINDILDCITNLQGVELVFMFKIRKYGDFYVIINHTIGQQCMNLTLFNYPNHGNINIYCCW